MPIPIIDSHIHLFPASHLPTLAWHGPNNPLASEHCVGEYRLASSSFTPTIPDPTHPVYLRGFIFIETARISAIEEELGDGWKHVLDEVSLIARIVRRESIDGEQHDSIDYPPCLGIVPWAPVPAGAAVLERYMGRVKERAGTEDVWKKVRGVRYLVQDKPAGVMLQPGFVDGLKWLGRKGFVFGLGVDARQGGLGQLREAVEMMKRVYEGVDEKEQVVMVIGMFSIHTEIWIPFNYYYFRSSLQTKPASSLRVHHYTSRLPGMDVSHSRHGTLSQDIHEALRRILRATVTFTHPGTQYLLAH